mgnify:CR=1 FL=1
MVAKLSITLEKPIESVTVIDHFAQNPPELSEKQKQLSQQIENQNKLNSQLKNELEKMSQLNKALLSTIDQCRNYQDSMIDNYKNNIAELAVVIAEKILCQKIAQKDYQITNIITQALENTPTRKDVVIHLNPQDLAQCQQQNAEILKSEGVQLISDANIAPAQCKIDTPKGIVETFIKKKIKNIEHMLKNME